MFRFGIRAQITVLCTSLIAIPLLAWSYWQELQDAALETQGRIQLIEAKAIATSLVATQANIADLLEADENSTLEKYALSAPAIKNPIRLDAKFNDWGTQRAQIEARDASHVLWHANAFLPKESAFGIGLAQNENYLYLALDVTDSFVHLRPKNQLRLDFNDHIKLTYQNRAGQLERIIIPAQDSGDLASYFTSSQWRYGVDQEDQINGRVTPSHLTDIKGYWQKTRDGYALELRINKDKFQDLKPRLHIELIDIDENPAFGPTTIIASLPKHLQNELNPLGIHAKELQRVIDQLKNTYAHLWIFDRLGREWAYASRERDSGINPSNFNNACVQNPLNAADQPLQFIHDALGKLSRIIACYPIIDQGRVLGVVVIDESADHILQKEESKVETIAIRLGLVMTLVILILLFYAIFLARRIARLNRESLNSIDKDGRIKTTSIRASKAAPDELGELSRTMSGLLARQRAYTNFVERIPQTLRHEIANPLNKVRTSLELLTDSETPLKDNRYVKRIEAGTEQISQITMHLTEAASIENAMQSEVFTELDLTRFLNRYLTNYESQIHLIGHSETPLLMLGDASRLEQLFDKLMDNAFSFCPQDGDVTVRIKRSKTDIVIAIENDGPLLAMDNPSHLFAPMSSTRSSGAEIHLGLGLHIAKLIADKHGIALRATNRKDLSGVIFEVCWPFKPTT